MYHTPARYVTVSAILSRTGALYPSKSGSQEEQAIFAAPASDATSTAVDQGDDVSLRRRRSKRRTGEVASGNALEALGALLLHSHNKGRPANMSFQRYHKEQERHLGRAGSSSTASQSVKGSQPYEQSLTSTYKAFVKSFKALGATTLGLRMPGYGVDQTGGTIAERRARRRQEQGAAQTTSYQTPGTTFVKVRTKKDQPTFEVAQTNANAPATPLPPIGKLNAGSGVAAASISMNTGPPLADPRLAFRRHHTSYTHDYGLGSSFGLQDLPEAPPSPLGMPGDWPGGKEWKKNGIDEDGALLLPPPLLDDNGSDAQSFEGLLGVRRRQKQEEARKRLERLAARNRPAHKVGMLTALNNFVKAAHAADQVARLSSQQPQKSKRPTASMVRRHTEKLSSAKRPSLEVERPESKAESLSFDSSWSSSGDASFERPRKASLPDISPGTLGHTLDTVYEGHTPSALPSPSSVHVTSPPPVSATSCRSSIVVREMTMSSTSVPRAPRLLPIQMSMPPSPMTPQMSQVPSRSNSKTRGRASQPGGDYLTARSVASSRDSSRSNSRPSSQHQPDTPRLGATMLSLPPSPWPSAIDADDIGSASFSLSLMSTAGHRVPGTPRLAPTHLNVVPSPYPSEPASLVSSPQAMAAGWSLSPQTGPHRSNGVPPSPTFQALDSMAGSISSLTSSQVEKPVTSRRESSDGQWEPPLPALTPAKVIKSEPSVGANGSATQPEAGPTAHISPAIKSERSFLLWWLIGDLGRNTLPSANNLPSTILCFLWDFACFNIVNLTDLILEIVETVSRLAWFVNWTFLNLTGRTVLSRCILDAYALIQAEWTLVADEDHEERKGSHNRDASANDLTNSAQKRPGGLTRWQVCRGFLEVVALQAVTKERWIREGAGLKRLEGWHKRPETESHSPMDTHSSSEEDEEDEELIVTRRDADILEFTRTPRIRPRTGPGEGYDYFATPARKARHRRQTSTGSQATVKTPRTLIRTIKWASRLAIGAYGLHVHIVELPPTFTPSGSRFTRQTFAHLSRLHGDDVLHADIQQMSAVGEGDGEEVYQPTFYVARDHVRKTVVVAIRGTQSFSDIIADLDMRTEKFPLPGRSKDPLEEASGDEDDEELTCHAGVLRAAQALIQSDSTLFSTLQKALEEHQEFGLTFVGHSLGSAIASAVVLLLGEYRPAKEENGDQEGWHLRQVCGLPAGRPLQAIAFAPPATFSSALASRAALGGDRPLVLAVVLGSDLIPRAGHGQARELRRVMGALSRVRRRPAGDAIRADDDEDDEQPAGEDARVYILRSWWRWRSLANKSASASTASQQQTRTASARPVQVGLSSSELQEKERIESQLWRLRCDVEADLYSATKRRGTLAAGNGTHASTLPPTPWMGPRSNGSNEPRLHQLSQRRHVLSDRTTALMNKREAALGGIMIPAGKTIYIEEPNERPAPPQTEAGMAGQPIPARLFAVEAPLSFFALPDFSATMFSSHLPSHYEAVLEDL